MVTASVVVVVVGTGGSVVSDMDVSVVEVEVSSAVADVVVALQGPALAPQVAAETTRRVRAFLGEIMVNSE